MTSLYTTKSICWEFQGAFFVMQSIHFYMMQHKTNFLAFALCCVKGTLMEMAHLLSNNYLINLSLGKGCSGDRSLLPALPLYFIHLNDHVHTHWIRRQKQSWKKRWESRSLWAAHPNAEVHSHAPLHSLSLDKSFQKKTMKISLGRVKHASQSLEWSLVERKLTWESRGMVKQSKIACKSPWQKQCSASALSLI